MNGVVLIVLDGFGIAPPSPGNAISLANPENYNSFIRMYPNTQLTASGEAVGLPPGEVGSTEVGHLNIGAGRIIYQSLPRINLSIADGSFYKNEALLKAVAHISKTDGALHIIGLVGSGNVHASVEHLYSLLLFYKEHGIQKVFIHVITDGRDSPPKAAFNYLQALEAKLSEMGIGTIASIMGRYYAMDRDRRWERIEKAYVCLTKGEGKKALTWHEAIDSSYKENKSDEFIEPTCIVDENGSPKALIRENDAVVFFNFRIDRPRELTKAFVLDDFENKANLSSFDPYAIKYIKRHELQEEAVAKPFIRGPKIPNLLFITMTEYERNLPVEVAFPPHIVAMPLGRIISQRQLFQLRVAESEKERFVTFYFNGLREAVFPYEERLIIPSPKVPTYNLKPEMSAVEIGNALCQKIYENKYSFILANFANPDMIGHTGDLNAAISAIKVVDGCLGKIAEAVLKTGYTLLITADHGNCEDMIDAKTGLFSTEHSGNPVPFVAVSEKLRGNKPSLQSGILADIAPTVLSLLHIPVPPEMTGRNLLEEFHV